MLESIPQSRKELSALHWKRFLWPLCYALLLLGFTAYVLLDTFVIVRAYTAVTEAPVAQSTPAATAFAPVVTDSEYNDGLIHITLTTHRVQDTNVYVADVTLSSPDYLYTALAKGTYGRNVTAKTSVTAQEEGAILAINGDYYGAQERGYVIRNGVLYRESAKDAQALVIGQDGSFRIVQEGEVSAQTLLEEGARQVFTFGPALVMGGEIAVTAKDEVGRAMANNPRTAIGVVEPLHYILLVSDGRTRQSTGLSLLELAEFLQELGVTEAYNLDGGGSSTMVFNGTVINQPTTNGRTITERSVSDIVCIGYGS